MLLSVTEDLGYVAEPTRAPCDGYELLSTTIICVVKVLCCLVDQNFLGFAFFPNCAEAPCTWQETRRGASGYFKLSWELMVSMCHTLLGPLAHGRHSPSSSRCLPFPSS